MYKIGNLLEKRAKVTTLIPFKKIKINHKQKLPYFGYDIHVGFFPLRVDFMKCCYLQWKWWEKDYFSHIIFIVFDKMWNVVFAIFSAEKLTQLILGLKCMRWQELKISKGKITLQKILKFQDEITSLHLSHLSCSGVSCWNQLQNQRNRFLLSSGKGLLATHSVFIVPCLKTKIPGYFFPFIQNLTNCFANF